MAEAVGVSQTSVCRIWHRHGLKPHLIRTFKLSRDPQLVEKMEAVIGLYTNPPEHAIVFSADEKSQQPGLPLQRGRGGTMTHDYKRNGTATLFAAMNILNGKVLSMCEDRHRHQEWLKFLKLIDQNTPSDKQIYLIIEGRSVRFCRSGIYDRSKHWAGPAASCASEARLSTRCDGKKNGVRNAAAALCLFWGATVTPVQIGVNMLPQIRGSSSRGWKARPASAIPWWT